MFSNLKPLVRAGLCRLFGALGRLPRYRPIASPIAYVVERGENWSIRWDGEYYARAVNRLRANTVVVADRPERLAGRIAHFGSQFVWELWTRALPASTRQLVTFFHGKPEDGPAMARHIDFFLNNLTRVELVVTAARPVESRLLAWGVPREKLVCVPLGVDTALFRPPSDAERTSARTAYGIPEDRICVGSFQKDGVGWGDGLAPKLIKGPDLLIDAVARLAKSYPIVVLLTGPARGYVKQGLERHGIPYRHVYLKDYQDVARAYHALDIYLMTSREEGGPKALLECLASDVALVSTRVGMASDLFPDPNDPRLVAAGDIAGMVAQASRLLDDPSLRRRLGAEGRETALAYDWDRVGAILYEGVYRRLLERPE